MTTTPATRRVLHVGCGHRTVATQLHPVFAGWRETRLDIDPRVAPDVVASITDMSPIESGTFDAIWSHHNLEHLEWHQVDMALREFRRVLKSDGFALIVVPDLQTVSGLVAQGMLEEPIYDSPAGPISAIDIIYGFRAAIGAGITPMAHRTGFVLTTLAARISEAGFFEAGGFRKLDSGELWAEARTRPGEPNHLANLLA